MYCRCERLVKVCNGRP